MTMQEQRRFRDEGNALEDLVKDQIWVQRVSGVELALITGRDEPAMSRIVNGQNHFYLTELPALVNRLGGEVILKKICLPHSKYPADLPTAKTNGKRILEAIGDVCHSLSNACTDGELTIKEIQQIKDSIAALNGAADSLMAGKVKRI